MKIPTCLCARLRGGGPEAARRSGQSSTAPAGERLSTIVRALLNGLKVLSRAALFRSPGYDAELRRKRFRLARRRREQTSAFILGLWRVGIITAQREVKARKLQWALFASFATHMAPRTGLPDPPLILFSSSTRPSATFLDSRPDAEFPHQRSSVAVCDQGQW